MGITADEMIYLQMTFPPPKKGFNFPAERINKSNLFGTEVGSVGGNPVGFASDAVTNQINGMPHLVILVTELDLCKEKDRAPFEKRQWL